MSDPPAERLSRPRRPVSWRKRLGFSLLAALLGYAFLEFVSFGLLLSLGGGAMIPMPSLSAIMQADEDIAARLRIDALHPYQGYVRYPAASHLHDAPRDVTDWGYSDRAAPLRKRSPGKLIVAVLGGSVAESFSHSQERRLTEELARVPRYAGRKVELVHLALAGYKQPQQLLQLTYLLLLGGEFDLVLNLDGFNELALSISENYPAGVVPSFPREWPSRVSAAQSWGARRAIGQSVYLDARRQTLADWFTAFPLSCSLTARCIWTLWDQQLKRELHQVRQAYAAELDEDRSPAAHGPFAPFASDEELYQHCVAVWERSSRQLHHLCAAHGIDYYHVLQPNQYVAGAKPFSSQERQLFIAEKHPYRIAAERGYPLLIEAGRRLQAEGIRFLDLTHVFAEHPETLYADDCCHVNDLGNDVLAEAILQFIREAP